jgi:uncharacterized protein
VKRTAALLLCAAELSGCHSSPAPRYYILSVEKSTSAAEGLHFNPLGEGPDGGAVSARLPVRLEQVRLPGELDRSQLVRRIGANRLQVEPGSRWAAPLDEMIRRVLSADLALRLPPGAVADPYQMLADGQRRALTLDVHELYGDSQCAVSLSATWVLARPRAQAGQAGAARGATEEVQVASEGPCPGSLAAAMSHALGVLADRMAAALVR